MQRTLLTVLIITVFTGNLEAQKELPDFSADDFGKNKVRISWMNQFGEGCVQLNVQASMDSLKNFRTIFSTESPQLPQNGFVYTLPFTAKFYYRISYILSGNAFYFTASKASILAPAVVKEPGVIKKPYVVGDPIQAINNTGVIINETIIERPIPQPKPEVPRIITVHSSDSVLARLLYPEYKKFKDSITKKTRDTLVVTGQDEILLKPFDPSSVYTPSAYLVINQDGFVKLKLPEAANKKYRLIIFDMDGKKLFTINHITETELVIDKTNFIHAGWFKFELYENDKLKEKNRILLQQDSR